MRRAIARPIKRKTTEFFISGRMYCCNQLPANMKQIEIQIRDKSPTTCWDILKKQVFEFCRETGLHGYKYIAQTERSRTERIVWAITVIISFCCGIVLINMTWDYYVSHPTMTIIESTHHGIWNYPFPAITICNLNHVSYNLAKKFVNNLKIPINISKEYLIQEMRLTIELLIPGVSGYDVQKNLTFLQHIIDDNNLSILDMLNSITQNCSALVVMCRWKGKIQHCEQYFKQSFARDGSCCSFNYITDMAFDNTERFAACGSETGMSLIVDSEPNDYYATSFGAYGVKTMIHYSYDYPDFNAESQLIQLGTEHLISVKPALMYSKEEVKNLAISTRNCIFDDEADEIYNIKKRHLNFAKYSYHNCLVECRASIAKAKCGCIPYYFPQNNTKVCDFRDVKCLERYQSYFELSWPRMEIQEDLDLPQTLNDIKTYPCGCIPDCNLYVYPIETSFSFLDPTIYYEKGILLRKITQDDNVQNRSLIHVFFNDLVAFQYQQSVNYSWKNLFASFGGLIGLFTGFSLMSIFEILYFFVIRLIIDVCNNLRKRNHVQ
ncbi:hypothetical protein HN011_002606 [Eciton burchellii]|nr:hypothetical protein HN011_002606 [Eciton burchellii]